mmetsp:Transcript_153315/g.267975  ORF Transcript_153315/g.267975 Transcript_153315/m.267975 type:complete len:115 (+) Transcript_153315:1305-1649(+)
MAPSLAPPPSTPAPTYVLSVCSGGCFYPSAGLGLKHPLPWMRCASTPPDPTPETKPSPKLILMLAHRNPDLRYCSYKSCPRVDLGTQVSCRLMVETTLESAIFSAFSCRLWRDG